MTDDPEMNMAAVVDGKDPSRIAELMSITKKQLDATYDILVQKGWGRGAWAHRADGSLVEHGFECRDTDSFFSIPGALSLAVIRDNPAAGFQDDNHETDKADLEMHALMVAIVNVLVTTKLAPPAVRALTVYERMNIFRDVASDTIALITMLSTWNESLCTDQSHALLVVQEAILMHEKGMKFHAKKAGN